MAKQELILGVDANYAEIFCSLNQLGTATTELNIDPLETWFIPREKAEHDEGFKHLIPYSVVKVGESILVYQRLSNGGENRLHGKVSIGFGGHITIKDAIITPNENIDPIKTIIEAEQRELIEELMSGEEIVKVTNPEFIGVIYDDSNEVGRVHLGIISIWNLEDFKDDDEFSEEELMNTTDEGIEILGLFTKEEILEQFEDRLESWSKITLGLL